MPDDTVTEPEEPIVDEDKVQDLRSLLGDGPEGVDGLIDTFVDRIPEVIEDLEQAASNGDLEEVGNLAHKVKGESATLGAKRLSELAKRIEGQARNDELADPEAAVQLLIDAYAETEDAYAARRKD